MKCISLLQPYAWVVAEGLKTAETRKWSTKYRGPLLIAASKRLDQGHYDHLKGLGVQLPRKEEFEYGKIIAITELADCTPFLKEHEEQALCALYPGFCFWLKNTKKLYPSVPVKGALGLYEVPWP